MPLIKGSSQEAISRNIAELHYANKNKSSGKKRSNDQVIAIAMSVAKKKK